MLSDINTAFMQLSRRAESYDREHLVTTFVDVGPLFTLLRNRDNQILLGRRGTGKTHALAYLGDSVEQNGDIAIQIDMRNVGSTGGIYSDYTLSIAERTTRLLIDTLTEIHDRLLSYALDHDNEIDLSSLGMVLDGFAEACTEVSINGSVQIEELTSEKNRKMDSTIAGLTVNPMDCKANIGINSESAAEKSVERRSIRSGKEHHRIHFGSVRNKLSEICDRLGQKRIWLMLDEWSEIPLDLQPYLADLLRRCIFSVSRITVKIGAIEQRCRFRVESEENGYIGIEVGADIATSLDLDEFMVFDNDANRAKDFFGLLLFNHIKPLISSNNAIYTRDDLIQQSFTQQNVFDEYVRAAEGVPRDAINIIGIAAQRAENNRISVNDIRVAAKRWYNRAKEIAVTTKREAQLLLRWIIDEVIGHRRARAFLLRSDIRHPLINFLFDSRVLHIIKYSVSGRDQPGVRYNVYSIDYMTIKLNQELLLTREHMCYNGHS